MSSEPGIRNTLARGKNPAVFLIHCLEPIGVFDATAADLLKLCIVVA